MLYLSGGGGWNGNGGYGNGNGGYNDFREPNPYQPSHGYHTPDNRQGRRHQRFTGTVLIKIKFLNQILDSGCYSEHPFTNFKNNYSFILLPCSKPLQMIIKEATQLRKTVITKIATAVIKRSLPSTH